MTNRSYLIAAFLAMATLGIFLAVKSQNSPPLLLEPETPGKTVAVKGVKSTYDLIETTAKTGGTGGSDISKYQPVTISYKVAVGDSLSSIATKYHADAQTIADYPYNEIGDDLNLKVGQVIIIPNGYIDTPPPAPPIAKGSGVLAWPFDPSASLRAGFAQGKPTISQYAYWWHAGAIDIAADTGSEVRAADNGKVITIEKLATGYGWHVVLDHGNGLTSLYGHLSAINVTLGQNVSKAQVLGLSGSTGRSTGPHLHFETRRDGQPVDPMTLLP